MAAGERTARAAHARPLRRPRGRAQRRLRASLIAGAPRRPARADGARRPLAQGPAQARRAPRRPLRRDHRAATARGCATARGGGEEALERERARRRGSAAALMRAAARPTATATTGAGTCAPATPASAVRVAGWVHRRRDHGGLIFIDLRDRSGLAPARLPPRQRARRPRRRPRPAQRGACVSVAGEVVARDAANVNPDLADRRDRARRRRARACSRPRRRRRSRSMRTPASTRRCGCATAPLDLRREPMRDAMVLRHAGRQRDPRACSTRSDFLEIETPILTRATPGGRARLPRALAPAARLVLRAAAVAADLQAAADDRRPRALLPDRALLPRRGPARRPPARVHPARRRDVVRHRGGRARGHRGGDERGVRRRRLRAAADAVAADALRRGDRRASAPTGPTAASASSSTTSARSCAAASSRSSSRCSTRGGVVWALNAGARELSRSRARRPQRRSSSASAPRRSRRSSSRTAAGAGNLAKFFARRADRGRQRRARGARRRPAALRRRPHARSRRRRSASCACELGERFGLIDRRAPRRALDRRLPDVRAQRRRGGAGPRCTTRSPRRRRRTARASSTSPIPGALRSRAYDLVVDGAELGGGSIRTHTPELQEQVFEVIGLDARGGAGPLRLPARRAALRRAAARRHRARHRPDRRDHRRRATRSAT